VGWGAEAADREGLESYLDASAAGKPLYEKHGEWVDFSLIDAVFNWKF